jgi:hypothetical protein
MILRYLTSGVSFGEDMKGILDWTAYQATFLDCNDSIRYFYLGSYDGDGSIADQKAYIKVHRVAGPRFDRTASSSLNDPPRPPEGRDRDYMDSSFADYVNNLHSASAWHYVTLLKETLMKCGKMLSDAAKALFGYASDLFTKVTSPFQKAWASIGNMFTRMTNCFKSCTEAQREFTKTYRTCALITAAFLGFGALLYAYSYKAPTSSVNFYLQGGMKYNNDQGRTRRGQAMEGFTEEELYLKNGYKSRIRAFEAANSTSIDRSRRAAAADYARNAKIDGRYRSAPQASPDFRKLVERAAVFIHSPSGLVYRGIGVCDRMVVVPHHYYNYFADFKTFVVTTGGHSMELEINELNRVHIPESDLSAFFLPPQFPMFPNIIPRFIKKEDLQSSTLMLPCGSRPLTALPVNSSCPLPLPPSIKFGPTQMSSMATTSKLCATPSGKTRTMEIVALFTLLVLPFLVLEQSWECTQHSTVSQPSRMCLLKISS